MNMRKQHRTEPMDKKNTWFSPSKTFQSKRFQNENISKISWNKISEESCYFYSHEFHTLYHSEMTRTASAVLAQAVNQMLSVKHMLIEKPTPARRHS